MSKRWICVLHFYQPPFQKPSILNQIVDECYLPLTQMLLEKKEDFCIYININQSLIEQLIENNHTNVIDNISKLIVQNKVRITLTPSYHPIIPLVPEQIVQEQIKENKKIIKKHLNFENYDMFFPPELAYDPDSKITRLTTLISQTALNSKEYAPLVKYKNNFFLVRNTILSNMIMGGEVRSFKLLKINEIIGSNEVFVTAVDAETFGHHRKGYILVLDNLLNELKTVWVSDVSTNCKVVSKLSSSSWSSIDNKQPFVLWKDSTNQIHTLLWQFLDFTKEQIKTKLDKKRLYQSMSSCTFWWSSANPWWSLEMLERGAWQMYMALQNSNDEIKNKGYEFYTQIVLIALRWQREGFIDKNFSNDLTKLIPFSKRCKKGELVIYINKFEQAEQQAVAQKNYELAIKWRDAITKLKNNTDQYDNWHVVDQLRNYQ